MLFASFPPVFQERVEHLLAVNMPLAVEWGSVNAANEWGRKRSGTFPCSAGESRVTKDEDERGAEGLSGSPAGAQAVKPNVFGVKLPTCVCIPAHILLLIFCI